jgi:hypothetical protein
VRRNWKTGTYGHHETARLKKTVRNVGAENAQSRTQNSPKKATVQNSSSAVTKTEMTVKKNYR